MNFKSWSDQELVSKTQALVKQEQRLVEELLNYLQEIFDRRLFAKLGYSSMFTFMTDELGYANATAQLRLDALKLVQELPTVKQDLLKNDASIHHTAQLQRFLRHEKKITKTERPREEKQKLWDEIKDKSPQETEKYLAQVNPEVFQAREKDRAKIITHEKTQISFVADEETMEMLNRLKELFPNEAHQYGLLIKKALKIALAKKDPKLKTNAPVLRPAESCTAKRRTYISVKIKRNLLAQANHECTYVSHETGRKCTERKNLQIEHIRPHAKGGQNTLENLTILCQQHNLQRAREEYGYEKISAYLSPPQQQVLV